MREDQLLVIIIDNLNSDTILELRTKECSIGRPGRGMLNQCVILLYHSSSGSSKYFLSVISIRKVGRFVSTQGHLYHCIQ